MRRLGRCLRRIADRIDREHAPKSMPLSFTIEPGRGIVVHGPGAVPRPGCPLWFVGDEDYARAHTETLDRLAYVDPSSGQWMGVAKP